MTGFWLGKRWSRRVRLLSLPMLVLVLTLAPRPGRLEAHETSGIGPGSDGRLAGEGRLAADSSSTIVTTLAGSGKYGFADGPATGAQFEFPSGIAVDAVGTVYVADLVSNRIRKIAPNGTVTTLAGSGAPGFADGPASSAQFSGPTSVAVDAAGVVYVADAGNNRIRKVTPAAGGPPAASIVVRINAEEEARRRGPKE